MRMRAFQVAWRSEHKKFREFFLSSIFSNFSFIDTMSEEKRRGDDLDEAGGPGAVYMQYVLMEGIIEKLKLLDYEKQFCQELGFKPFSRYVSSSPNHRDAIATYQH